MKNITKKLFWIGMITLMFSCNESLFIENISVKDSSSGTVSLNNQFTFNGDTHNVRSAGKNAYVNATCKSQGGVGAFLIDGEIKNGLYTRVVVLSVRSYNFNGTPGFLTSSSCNMEVQVVTINASTNLAQTSYGSIGEGTVEITNNSFRITNVKLKRDNESTANFSVSGGGTY